MKVIVTGSAGHLGEALVRVLKAEGHEVMGLDILRSPFTTNVGSIVDHSFVHACMQGVEVVYHAAALHKPHVVTHDQQQFLEFYAQGWLDRC